MFVTSARPSLGTLNEGQLLAATHPGGPLLILAGAGTGKTTTLCARVAWLIEQGVAPERILLLTFTRRAAREMLARTRALVARGARRRAWRRAGSAFRARARCSTSTRER